jgi:thiamine biosynthesis protein ThiS
MSEPLITPQPTPGEASITVRTDRGPVQLPAGSSVADALVLLVCDADRTSSMATAVNGEFVSRHARPTHRLQDGDALLLFGAITGG